MRQAVNPFLPCFEYIPDGEPHEFDGRVYLYGSHDRFNGINFCLNDYVCWSAPVSDLSDWRYEGVIFKRKQDPKSYKPRFLNGLYAPDVCKGKDGKYYLYYFVGYTGLISVAVCDTPAGKYEFLGHVRYEDGIELGKKKEPLQFDPGIFVDDDGRIYLYTGFGPVKYPKILMGGHSPSKHGAMGFELNDDMLTLKSGLVYIGIKGKGEADGGGYEGHEFFEASSMRKYGGKYYFVYSSYEGHELCWAHSDNPLSGFEYGGVLISNGDIGYGGRTKDDAVNYTGNNHGGLLNLGDKYYIFYHRQTNKNQFSRQACAEEIEFKDGKFKQASLSSCGLNSSPLDGEGEYGARIACGLYSNKGTYWYGVLKRIKRSHPYFTQTGKDREINGDQYIANFRDGAVAVFKTFNLAGSKSISVRLRCRASGKLLVYADLNLTPCAEIPLKKTSGIAEFCAPLKISKQITPLYFTFKGKGKTDFLSFKLMR